MKLFEDGEVQSELNDLKRIDEEVGKGIYTGDNSKSFEDIQPELMKMDGQVHNLQHQLMESDFQEEIGFPQLYLPDQEPFEVDAIDLPSESINVLHQDMLLFDQNQQKLKPKGKSESKRHKNSNSIKKLGRLILDHIDEFKINGRENAGVKAMKVALNRSNKLEHTAGSMRDRFNLTHLSQLLKVSEVSQHNLRTTRKLLSKHVRKQILRSNQISNESKLIYMNTLKCSGIRCANSTLAVRLQMSEK